MFLSRLTLNPRSRAVRRDLADCQHLHRTVMSGFRDGLGAAARAQSGVLHRLEVVPERGLAWLYVQSEVEPDWSHLPQEYLLADPEVKPVANKYAAVSDGMVLAFRLRANPTRKVDTKTGPDGKRRNGRRYDLRREEEQVQWLQRKAERGGFRLVMVRSRPEVADTRVVSEQAVVGKVTGEHARGRLTFGSVLFEGQLQVTDARQFQETLRKGVGSAKAYGFGLLSIAPARL